MVNGEAFPIPSPCGANCSYTTTFYGPYFVCNTSTANETFTGGAAIGYSFGNNTSASIGHSFPNVIYNGASSINEINEFAFQSSSTGPSFQTTLWSPLASGSDELSLIATKQNMTCLPYRAQYALSNRYENGIQSTKISASPLRPLVSMDLEIQALLLVSNVSDANISDTIHYNISNPIKPNTTLDWGEASIARYCDLSLVNIVGVVATALSGEYTCSGVATLTKYNVTLPGYEDLLWSLNNSWSTAIGADQLLFGAPHGGMLRPSAIVMFYANSLVQGRVAAHI